MNPYNNDGYPTAVDNSLTPVEQAAQAAEGARRAAVELGETGPAEARACAERISWRIAVAGTVLALVISVGGGLVTYSIASSAATAVANESVKRQTAEADRKTVQLTTDQAIQQLRASNDELRARGQAPVASPGPAPSSSDALVAAATARVLAALPQAPTTAQIGQMIALAVAAQPVPGPTSAQLSTAVAGYLAANPPPAGVQGERGDQGPKGDPGPPPTALQINDAVAAYLAANPPVPGQPPLRWTYNDALNAQRTCVRDDPFDPAAPTYTCK